MNIHKWVLAIRRPLNLMSKKDSLHLHFYFCIYEKTIAYCGYFVTRYACFRSAREH